ncbi:MAG: MTH938/NDUFAF3 family protein [Gammaproteobacteria bacterium]|nr:MTH938/NDUFAF3 family protein [Gammaproteobacteria bacterium]MDH4252918.1 MTH938/NDUFAF3 family protein [Gammaproteobacteria bacterium]MDH5308396.1 MTH938/NDUFAF3 family protein [Gammaproteobacteria bacterium]
MKFTRDTLTELTIRKVERGRIRIGEEFYESSFALTIDRVLPDVEAVPVADLRIEHLERLLESDPEVVIIGTGWHPAFARRELTFALARRGIGLEVMDTPAACRTFNILIGEGRRPAALMIID